MTIPCDGGGGSNSSVLDGEATVVFADVSTLLPRGSKAGVAKVDELALCSSEGPAANSGDENCLTADGNEETDGGQGHGTVFTQRPAYGVLAGVRDGLLQLSCNAFVAKANAGDE